MIDESLAQQIYSLSQGMLQGSLAAQGSRRQRRWAEKMWQRQLDANRAEADRQWQIMTEYNSPKAQMLRYQEAGINPMAVIGGITSGNTEYQAVDVPQLPERRDDLLEGIKAGSQAYQQMQDKLIERTNAVKQGQLLDAQIQKTEMDSQLANQQISDIISKIHNRSTDSRIKQLTGDYLATTFNTRALREKYNTDIASEELYKAEFYNTTILPLQVQQYVDNHKESVVRELLAQKQLSKIDKEMLLLDKEIDSRTLANMVMKYNFENILPHQKNQAIFQAYKTYMETGKIDKEIQLLFQQYGQNELINPLNVIYQQLRNNAQQISNYQSLFDTGWGPTNSIPNFVRMFFDAIDHDFLGNKMYMP